ncbi:demethylrebeccamycin-D-glucose O-methyltransferase [mine drainage metagenome]|uniref:Demethylrebeccamycin-D-glucose O-methyltransferase n=1 Tax=mine drainage metagenome TaxID=410659 RepID=A0A1J5RSU2_9ZZZZ
MPNMQLTHPNIQLACSESDIYESLLALDDARILELGCGKADHTRRIAKRHRTARIIAAEVDRVQLGENLAAAVPENISFADFGAESIPLPDASQDVVMMFRSLHHVPLPRLDDALHEILRVLKPGGCAYISEPVFAGPLNEMIRIFNDEEVVRAAAFETLRRAVDTGMFELANETFFLVPVAYQDFTDFARKHFHVTHSERNVSDAQRLAAERLFNTHLRPDGVKLSQQVRVDLLRKPL